MNVLSLFDGMGCGKIALNKLGIQVSKYYSSEVDKYASGVSKFLHNDSIQLGDVRHWQEWNLTKIDLLIGGSPCQGFSFAGKQKGMSTDCKIEIITHEQYLLLKLKGFQFNGQSYLFWEYISVLIELRKTNPDIKFLLENVVMAKKWEKIITELLGVEPIMINSSLVSAQNRRRLYWCNWHAEQPEDKGIFLKDIIDHSVNEKIIRSKGKTVRVGGELLPPTSKQNWDAIAVIKNRGELQERNDKAMRIDANYHKGADNHGQRTQIITHPCELRETIPTGECHHVANALDIKGHDHMKRVYADSGKSPTVNTCTGGNREVKLLTSNITYRKLTPIECERLQTVQDNSTRWGIINNKYVEISNSQRYKMLGNGWNVDTIVHILRSCPL